jgi:hypothetical protein
MTGGSALSSLSRRQVVIGDLSTIRHKVPLSNHIIIPCALWRWHFPKTGAPPFDDRARLARATMGAEQQHDQRHDDGEDDQGERRYRPCSPDAERSRDRQIATAANALYEAFLKGGDLPVSIEDWSQAARALSTNVGPPRLPPQVRLRR